MGLSHQWQGHAHEKAREGLPRRGYTVDRAGLMSAAKSTLSDDVHHRMLPPWGLYFFNFSRHFPIDARFRECVNHDDAMPRMVTCSAFDSTQKESTTPKGVAFASHLPPRVASYRRQPRAIESITPMGLHRHQPFITTPQPGMRITLRWSCAHHCPFITTPQREDGARHGIYHHTTTRSVPMPQREIACIMSIHCQTTA